MSELKLKVPKRLLEDIRAVWEINRERMTEDTMDMLEWDSVEDFAADILVYGFSVAAEDPVAFVRDVRDQKTPIFKDPRKSMLEKQAKEDYRKAYS